MGEKCLSELFRQHDYKNFDNNTQVMDHVPKKKTERIEILEQTVD